VAIFYANYKKPEFGKASKFDAPLASVPLGDTSKAPNQQTASLPNFGNTMYVQKFLKLTRFF